MKELSVADRMKLDLGINLKVKPFIEKHTGLQAGSSVWNYGCADFLNDKIDLRSYGLCKENSIGQYKKLQFQKFGYAKLSEFQEMIDFIKKLLKNKGFNFDFCKKVLKISLVINYKDNTVVFNEDVPHNKDFATDNKKLNKEDTLVMRVFYVNELDVKMQSEPYLERF